MWWGQAATRASGNKFLVSHGDSRNLQIMMWDIFFSDGRKALLTVNILQPGVSFYIHIGRLMDIYVWNSTFRQLIKAFKQQPHFHSKNSTALSRLGIKEIKKSAKWHMKFPVKIELKVRLQSSGCGRGDMWRVYFRCMCNCVIEGVLNSAVETMELLKCLVLLCSPRIHPLWRLLSHSRRLWRGRLLLTFLACSLFSVLSPPRCYILGTPD